MGVVTPDETPEARLKRLKIRAWRRGIKEMDLILGPYADANLASMSAEEVEEFDALLKENDQDLYQWVSGQAAPPAEFAALVTRLGQTGSR
ncbi:succinate dehydrogenase assembly factor 2 [Dinoroseobacter sp. S124A]|uniref:FAD assembly factor SdhE n=1 Tax=Dinoroseobacter sp. S124A TaxID=3415128 RepID=UPI003C7C8928